MNRRGFLVGILAAGMAPAVVRAASLMKVVSPAGLVAPEFYFSFDDEFVARYLRPAMMELANRIDREALQWDSKMLESLALTPKRPYVIERPIFFIANEDWPTKIEIEIFITKAERARLW